MGTHLAPTSRQRKPSYVALEGCIGVGKTTLCHALGERFDAEVLLEKVDENPFLAEFYQDPSQHAFKTQIFFLLSRYNQQQGLKQRNLFQNAVVSDYFIAKDRIFAELNLTDSEFKLYEQLYNTLLPQIQIPDLIIYLRAPIGVILDRIQRRGRKYEQDIDVNYLVNLMAAYDRFFARYTSCPVLIVDTEELNFPQQQEHVTYVIDAISETLQHQKSTHLVTAGKRSQESLL